MKVSLWIEGPIRNMHDFSVVFFSDKIVAAIITEKIERSNMDLGITQKVHKLINEILSRKTLTQLTV